MSVFVSRHKRNIFPFRHPHLSLMLKKWYADSSLTWQFWQTLPRSKEGTGVLVAR